MADDKSEDKNSEDSTLDSTGDEEVKTETSSTQGQGAADGAVSGDPQTGATEPESETETEPDAKAEPAVERESEAAAKGDPEAPVTESEAVPIADSDAVPIAGAGAAPVAPESDAPSAPEPAGGGSKFWIVSTFAAVPALIVVAALAGFFFVRDHDSRSTASARESARQGACAYAPALANYDYKKLDAYVRGVLAGATGNWKKEFENTSKGLRNFLEQGQVVSKVTDSQCAIKSGDKDTAEAIVVIGQMLSSIGTKGQPQPGQLAVVMTLHKEGDRWLVEKLSAPLLNPGQ